MTRRDYVMLSAALLNAKPAPTWSANKHAQHTVDCKRIADALLGANPKHFDHARFLNDCGVSSQ